jgi:hypothetical protein
MFSSRGSWKRVLVAAGAAVAVAAPLSLSAGTAHAVTGMTRTTTLKVLASGLNNPRGITVLPDGTILVAESGAGDPNCAAGQTCAGLTGSVYAVHGSFQGRVVTGLASTATGPATPGASVSAAGPNAVVPDPKGGYDVLSEFGGTDDSRAALGPNGVTLGTLLRTRDHAVLADPVDYETKVNPDGEDVHSNPWGLLPSGSDFLITEAGANDLLRAHPDGSITTDYVFPHNTAATGSQQAVPTGIVRAGDGTIYISDMSATTPGAARIWQIKPGQAPQVFLTGFSNLVSLALDHSGNLFALSFTAQLGAPPQPGSLSKINLATKQVTQISTGTLLQQPTGLAIGPNNEVYVTNNSNGTSGQLVRVLY